MRFGVCTDSKNLPVVADAGYDYIELALKDIAALCAKWSAALKKCGYDGRISLEGHFGEDFVGALPILKDMF